MSTLRSSHRRRTACTSTSKSPSGTPRDCVGRNEQTEDRTRRGSGDHLDARRCVDDWRHTSSSARAAASSSLALIGTWMGPVSSISLSHERNEAATARSLLRGFGDIDDRPARNGHFAHVDIVRIRPTLTHDHLSTTPKRWRTDLRPVQFSSVQSKSVVCAGTGDWPYTASNIRAAK